MSIIRESERDKNMYYVKGDGERNEGWRGRESERQRGKKERRQWSERERKVRVDPPLRPVCANGQTNDIQKVDGLWG